MFVCFILFCMFFVCKQKTAYEMRISDWSSDVCSSDLERQPVFIALHPTQRMGKAKSGISGDNAVDRQLPPKRAVGGPEIERAGKAAIDRAQPDEQLPDRSEERRVGKEGVSQFRTRWSQYHLKTQH